MSELAALLGQVTAVGVLGLALLVFGAWALLRAQRSEASPIDFAHTLQDPDGRTSLRKVGEWVALLSSTWLVVFLATAGRLTDWIFGLWLVAWVSRAALGALIGAKAASMVAATSEPR
jgi:hypothetical protein